MDHWLHNLSVSLADSRGVRGHRAGHWADVRHDEHARRERAGGVENIGSVSWVFMPPLLCSLAIWRHDDKESEVMGCLAIAR